MKIIGIVRRILLESKDSDELKGTYNPELDKFEDIDLFPEKTAKAREMLKNVSLPPELQNRRVKK